MTELLDLCYDVLIRILEEINPEDLAACAQTSKGFNEFIKANTRLYKAHLLKNFVWIFGLSDVVQSGLTYFRTTRDEGRQIQSRNG
jgi:hypothetical protein